MSKSTKHEFALYSAELSNGSSQIVLTDIDLLQRIYKVLRLSIGDTLVLFDGKNVMNVVIANTEKKQCIVAVQSRECIRYITPEVHCVVPVLKREALEDVMYAAVELGANTIQLVFTEKIHRAWAGAKEFERLHGIMIAACEQAKQFMVPQLHAPKSFDEVLPTLKETVLFFDVNGQPAYDVVTQLRKEKLSSLTMLMGPEADLSDKEKTLLKEKGAICCKLTPTVLRAKQAFAVGLGMLRSMVN